MEQTYSLKGYKHQVFCSITSLSLNEYDAIKIASHPFVRQKVNSQVIMNMKQV